MPIITSATGMNMFGYMYTGEYTVFVVFEVNADPASPASGDVLFFDITNSPTANTGNFMVTSNDVVLTDHQATGEVSLLV